MERETTTNPPNGGEEPIAPSRTEDTPSRRDATTKRTADTRKNLNPSKKARIVVPQDALMTLASSYQTHYSQYCKGRKRVGQRVPASVWKLAYKDFLDDQRLKAENDGEVFDSSTLPAERTLQDALRTVLAEMNTGTSDDGAAREGLASLQDEDVLVQLKKTDTFNRKKMSDFREALIAGTVETRTTDHASSSEPRVSAAQVVNDEAVEKTDVKFQNKTKKELFASAVNAISEMTAAVEANSTALTETVTEQNSIFKEDCEGKKMLREQQLATLKSEELDRQINRLATLRDAGVLSDEEFKSRVKKIAGL